MKPAPSTTRFGSALRWLTLICVCSIAAPAQALPKSIKSYARIQDDASLVISGHVIRLHGIYIPATERSCMTWNNPTRCADRAVLQLEFKIQGFVECLPVSRLDDGSLSATCYVNRSRFDPGEDLAAYLLRYGWAVALPDAPFEYHALEEIARHNGFGIWGFRVDTIR